MALPAEYQRLAGYLGVTRRPNESDQAFMDRLDSMSLRRRQLLHTAKTLGLTTRVTVTNAELCQLICQHLNAELTARRFVAEAQLKLGDLTIGITRIVTNEEAPSVTVHFWIISPWEKDNNRGRSTHLPAQRILEKGELIN